MADDKKIFQKWFGGQDPPKQSQSKTSSSHRRRNSVQVNNNNNNSTSSTNLHSSQSSSTSANSPPNPFPTELKPKATPSRMSNQRRPSLFTQNSHNQKVYRNVTVCGPMGVGKTSICKVLLDSDYSRQVDRNGTYVPTHEENYVINTKVNDEDGETNVQLTILDTQGSDNPDLHNRCPQQFVNEKDGFIIVYDVNCDKSFNNAKEFLQKLICDEHVQPDEKGILLVGNKTDKTNEDDLGYDDRIEEAREYCDEMDLELEPQFISATRGDEVQGIFTTLCQHIETLKKDLQSYS